jgi:glycosyltransferase involved in cell wall biosynthesis
VLFTSLYEGFGLPVLEAMQLGTPVLTSTTSSLPEVAGDAALLVDPYDPGAMSEALRQLDGDDALRARLSGLGLQQARRFAPAEYSARLAGLYRTVLGRAVGGSRLN